MPADECTQEQGFQRGATEVDAFENANIQYLIEKRPAEMQKLCDVCDAWRQEGQRKKVAHYSYPCLATFRFSDRQAANIACFLSLQPADCHHLFFSQRPKHPSVGAFSARRTFRFGFQNDPNRKAKGQLLSGESTGFVDEMGKNGG